MSGPIGFGKDVSDEEREKLAKLYRRGETIPTQEAVDVATIVLRDNKGRYSKSMRNLATAILHAFDKRGVSF